MNTHEKDPYLNGISHYDELGTQVNNVIAGKAPNSFDFKKMLKNPLVYLTAIFVIFMVILWVWSPGFVKDEKGATKIMLLLIISAIVAVLSSGALWFFWLRKIHVE
jgi:hypothetical protein